MMLLTAATTQTNEQEQKHNASSSSDSISTTTTDARAELVTQTASATNQIDWIAIVRHLSGHSQLTQTQFATPSSPSPIRVLVEVTDPNQENRKLVECYLQAAAHYGVSSHEASEAFTPIALKFLPHILKRLQVARKYNLQREDAEDIAQEAMLGIWNWLNSYLRYSTEAGDDDRQQEQEQKKELNNLWQLITIIVRNCAANWLQHQYRARSRAKNQRSSEDAVTNPLRFVSLHHVPLQILTSTIRDFGRELELSPSHYSNSVRSSERSKSGSGSGSSRNMKSDLLDQLYDVSTGVEAVVEQRELLKELAAAITEMGRTKPHYRLVLMEHVKGRSHRQIADENNWTLDQVKKYLTRARAWLANYFASASAPDGDESEKEKEKESRVASGSVPKVERERKKVNKSKPTTEPSTEEWQVAAD
jgi:RNA polymerase sigma factor (sigma-70 family)